MRPRLIVVLTLIDSGVFKTTKFTSPRYIGDPINSARLFSDLGADEMLILDISDYHNKNVTRSEIFSRVVSHAFTPLAAGGGIARFEDACRYFDFGYDKIVIGKNHEDYALLSRIASSYGAQALSVILNYSHQELANNDELSIKMINKINKLEQEGVGEVILHANTLDGTLQGFDKNSRLKNVIEETSIPVVLFGGGVNLSDAVETLKTVGCHSVAASSMFIYSSKRGGILLNYPSFEIREKYLGI